MAFNPLQNFLGGQQAGQRQQANNLAGSLAGQAQNPEFRMGQSEDFRQLMAIDPDRANKTMSTFQSLGEDRKKAYFDDMVTGKAMLMSGDLSGFGKFQENRLQNLKRLESEDTTGTEMIIDKFNQGDIQGLIAGYDSGINAGIQLGYIKAGPQAEKKGTKQAEFENLVKLAEVDPKGETIAGKAALVSLGLFARASNSAAERIATNPELAQAVAKSEELKAESKEAGKSKAQLNFKPKIESAVKLAAIEAESRGEALTDLARMEATMPEMQKVVGQLRELSEISTSTMGGRFFDVMVKETGFGATKGGTARAKLISIIDNQVLPLLKATFGGAMTEREGDKLTATMGDPNATHEARMAALDAFIDQKAGAIMSLKREVSKPLSLSDEDLLRKYQ